MNRRPNLTCMKSTINYKKVAGVSFDEYPDNKDLSPRLSDGDLAVKELINVDDLAVKELYLAVKELINLLGDHLFLSITLALFSVLQSVTGYPNCTLSDDYDYRCDEDGNQKASLYAILTVLLASGCFFAFCCKEKGYREASRGNIVSPDSVSQVA